jgi:RNA 3'-terminal phosphate cyclase
MPVKETSGVEPEELLREMNMLAENAAAAIDQLVSQRKALLDTAQTRAAELTAQVQRLNELYKSANGRYYVLPAEEQKPAEAGEGAGKRTHRSKAEGKQIAEAIVEFIASKGAAGASGAEIKARFPGIFTMSIKDFVKTYGELTLRDNGAAKAAMRYLPPVDVSNQV